MKGKIAAFFVLSGLIGLTLGLGSFTFIYGKGYSYLQDDPKACVNCHIMRDQYDSWLAGPHSKVASCNSCHTPENVYLKYFSKAENGFNHSWKFTLKTYNDPIKIRAHNFDMAMKACLRCHGGMMDSETHAQKLMEGRSCVHCHKDVGHAH